MTDSSLRAPTVLRAGSLAGVSIVDTITLDRQSRYRRRVLLTTDSGRELLLDLPEATYLADGDALAIEGGLKVRQNRKPSGHVRRQSTTMLSELRPRCFASRATHHKLTATATTSAKKEIT